MSEQLGDLAIGDAPKGPAPSPVFQHRDLEIIGP
jgi:hypothetical protein